MARSLSIGTWNVAWRKPLSSAATTIRQRLFAADPDVVCLTEADANFLDNSGHTATADADYGYPLLGNRRKVILWSKAPWEEIDIVGDAELPPGRFVAARTQTAIGRIMIVGVCIPWAAAHVSTGRRDRKRWDEHLSYLSGLGHYLAQISEPFVIIGDFNQAIPRRQAPAKVFDALQKEVLVNVRMFTAGEIEGCGFAIDHISGSKSISCTNVTGLSAVDESGKQLSDHFGIIAELKLR